MPSPTSSSSSTSVFRVDRFVVPPSALAAFIDQLRAINAWLGALPGCKQNLVLSRPGNDGETNLVTVVEWADTDAVTAARAAMQEKYAAQGFDPAAFMRQLGVRADMGSFTAV